MNFYKIMLGKKIEFELEQIEEYKRFSLYQVYKLENGNRIPLYKECYSKSQLNHIANKGYIVADYM